MAADVWFRSERVIVRRLVLRDLGAAYVSWFSDPKVRQFIKYAREAPTLASLQDYWRMKNADPAVDFLGLFDATSGVHIGNMKFELGPAPGEAHVGFLIGSEAARGRGLLRECLADCVRRLRQERGALEVYLTVDPHNSAALAAFARLGFRAAGDAAPGRDLRMDFLGC